MSRPTLEVADLIRAQGHRFLDRYKSSFRFQQLKVFRALQNCRTAALGGHLDACSSCGYQAISYNSCRNRHCPKCQTQARQRWLAAREQEVLPTNYFHVVFSVPHELNVGAEIGILAILHTWGQNLLLHPHIHCVVPAGGLAPDHRRWISVKGDFLLPVPVLRKVFRGKFIAGLKRLRQRGKLCRSGPAAVLAEPKPFAKLLRRLHRRHWVVYAKAPFGGPRLVLRYLGRYTHRVAISNHRLTAFDGEHVTFQWKDYAHGSVQKSMTLAATEFLRRFFLHVLPRALSAFVTSASLPTGFVGKR